LEKRRLQWLGSRNKFGYSFIVPYIYGNLNSMTTGQIKNVFLEAIQEKAVYNKLEGITENQIYNWRRNRTTPSIGDMLGVLYQLNKISISFIDKSKRINTIEGLNKLPEIVQNMFGEKRTLAPTDRPNSNKEAVNIIDEILTRKLGK
jgi:hypothetical protein